MYCTNCGFKAETQAKFCFQCGKLLNTANPTDTENNDRLGDDEYLKKFHEVNKNNNEIYVEKIPLNTKQNDKDDDFKNNDVARNLKRNYFFVFLFCFVMAFVVNQPVFWVFFMILSAILFPYKK